MKKLQRGFNLLELMSVVSIIGVLGAMALPAYQDYSAKTQIHTAYISLSLLKARVELKMLTNEEVTQATEVGWITNSSSLLNSDPEVSASPQTGIATISAILNKRVNTAALNVRITLSRDPQGRWHCTLRKSESLGWRSEFAPKDCTIET